MSKLLKHRLTPSPYLGLYYWTHYYASPNWRNMLSFLVGYSNTLGLVGGLCSIDCMFSGAQTIAQTQAYSIYPAPLSVISN